MASHHLLATSCTETWAISPRAGLPVPLAIELVSTPLSGRALAALSTWLEGYARRGPPWQEPVEVGLAPTQLSVVFERFIGVTLGDLVRNLSDERWVLPPRAWLSLALDCFDAFERCGEVLLAEPPCPTGLGWGLDGRLVLAPLVLNAPMANAGDVPDHTALFTPEHVHGWRLDERSLVFMLAQVLTWMLTGMHPLEAEAGGHVGGLLRAERPLAAAWKLGASPALVEVLDRALSHERDGRFPTLGQLREAVCQAVAAPPLPRVETFCVVQAATHRLVDRHLEHLWSHDALLPPTWEGLWPAGVHPLEGLSVIEDRLLEHRFDKRLLTRRAEVGHSLRPWRTPPERAEDQAAFRRADQSRWWFGETVARLPWRTW